MRMYALIICMNIVFFCGCVNISTPYPNIKQYTLTIDAERQDRARLYDYIITDFTAAAKYQTKNFIYRSGEYEYETDYYNRFLVSPEAMIRELTSAWFREDERDADEDKAVRIIEGKLIELYADYRNEQNPEAVISIQYDVYTKSNNGMQELLFQRTYKQRVQISEISIETLVSSWSEGIRNILKLLDQDIFKKTIVKSEDII